MLSTVQKGDMQCAAHCARLTLLEFVEELFERQVPAPSQEHPNAFCEGLHDCFVILSPSLRLDENYVDCAWEVLKNPRYRARHLTKTR